MQLRKLRQDGGPITSVGDKLTDDGAVRLHVCVRACRVPRLVGTIYYMHALRDVIGLL